MHSIYEYAPLRVVSSNKYNIFHENTLIIDIIEFKKWFFLWRAWITFIFAVGADVKVKGKIVIQADAPLIDSIKSSQEERMAGLSGKISFAIQLVETVDEQNIPISGQFVYEGKSEVCSNESAK